MNLVTIATFDVPEKAHIAKNRLEAEGVTVTLQDELTAGWVGQAGALAQVKLQVHGHDAERAKKILLGDETD